MQCKYKVSYSIVSKGLDRLRIGGIDKTSMNGEHGSAQLYLSIYNSSFTLRKPKMQYTNVYSLEK